MKSQTKQSGFTLIEALIVIAIIGVLASMTLMVLADGANSAKVSRAKVQVRKINDLIMDRWEEFESRPLRFKLTSGSQERFPKNASRIRLYALRVLMRIEMPERMSDIIVFDPAVNLADNVTIADFQSLVDFYQTVDGMGNLINPIEVPLTSINYEIPGNHYFNSLHNFYFARIFSAVDNPVGGNPITWQQLLANQGAECLYLILASAQDEYGNGLDSFSDSDIGDTDGDGLQEILDPWGTPISFLRWAPGLSETGSPSTTGTISPIQSAIATQDPDPFDPLRADIRNDDAKDTNDPFRLVPLVFSAGPDRQYDIWRRDEFDRLVFDGTDRYVNYSYFSPEANIVNDPFWGWGLDSDTVPSVGFRLDTDQDGTEGYFDNLDNHFGLEE